jgi:hypothetical protein
MCGPRGNYVAVGHAPNLGADPIHFLWQLRHNTAQKRNFGYLLDNTEILSSGFGPISNHHLLEELRVGDETLADLPAKRSERNIATCESIKPGRSRAGATRIFH